MKMLFKFIKQTIIIDKMYPVVLLVSSLFNSFVVIFAVISPKILIDAFQSGKTLNELLLIGSIIVLINFVVGAINNYFKTYFSYKNTYVSEMYFRYFSDKIAAIEYGYLEDPYYLDLKERAIFSATNQGTFRGLMKNAADLIQYFITLITLLSILSSLGVWLIIILAAGIAFNLFLIALSAKTQINFFTNLVPINRKFGYYFNTIMDTRLAKDFRLYNSCDLLVGRVDGFQQEMNKYFSKFYKKSGLIQVGMDIVSGLQSLFIYGYVTVITIRKNLGIGNFSMYVNGALNFSTTIRQLIDACSQFYRYWMYLKPYMEFMSIPNENQSGKQIIFNDEVNSIQFENVTFKYPRLDQIILDNISFEIQRHEHISIVGLNGAGKTTLVKLLCRFYRPTSGRILINGIDIWDYESESYNKAISCVFQDFKLFSYSIKDNIVGNHEATDEEIEKIITAVGLTDKIKELPQGIHTNLGKELDNEAIELSGGQNQKIAIARAIYKNASLVILDEPTSALDPMSEAEIYQNFNDLVGNKTAIYISHRMSSSVFCDKVLVIDGGKVSDYDTHKNLMKKTESLYYKMFNAQAVNYQTS